MANDWRDMASLGHGKLTNEQLETHECVLSTVATDALMFKNHVASIHNAD